ncbi:MAG: hypothetical protein FJ150_01300 [Euryarchaeota archaeon]|nr:hypothetical protein [Euryarchaeota archaeon]
MIDQKNLGSGIILATIFVFLLAVGVVSAHQPRLDIGADVSIENPIIVQNPEISQAFYGELNGKPDYYKISSDKTFKLYINLLVPASPGISGDFVSAEVLDANKTPIIFINGTNASWKPYFEEFGGDNYLKGPEVRQTLGPGTYYIKVFNAENQGKYSIAIGEIESFPVDESLKALITLPQLKEKFFGKPVSTLFLEFLGIILALGSIMALFAMLIKSRKSEEMTQITIKVSGALKPVIWLGIIITTVVWAYVMYKDPLNILGLVNSLILAILIILNWYLGSKMVKMEFGKLPIKSMVVFVILWWIFVFECIAVI